MLEGAGDAVLLLSGVVGVWLLARLIRSRSTSTRPFTDAFTHGQPATRIVAATLVGAPLALVAPHSAWPVYMSAAAIGAFATSAITMAASEIDAGFGTTFYSIPWLRPVEASTPGVRSAAGLAAAVGAAFAVPVWAGAWRLVGPGEAALIAMAALAAAAVDSWLCGRRGATGGVQRLGPGIAAALLGASAAAILVAFLP